MNRKYKLDCYKDIGWKYNKDTGDLISHKGNIIKSKNKRGYVVCNLIINGKNVCE